ncbi:DUF2380 domain-containing protein [Corallococcus sp. H22C18031201]|nr:DUF2380 domain-containing protein [Corallococcus sp. H22C18031201]
MRADASWWGIALVVTSFVAVTPAHARGRNLNSLPRAAEVPALVPQSDSESPRDFAPRLPVFAEPDAKERLTRRRETRENQTEASAVGGGLTSAKRTRQAVLGAIDDVKGSTGSITLALSKLASRQEGIGGANGVFTRYVDYGTQQLPWLNGALAGSTSLTDAAAEVADDDMELGILRMTGPRVQAAMFGAMLLASWTDFLRLADLSLQQFPSYSTERLFMDMDRVQRLLAPTMTALASGDPEQVEAAATAMPELMGKLTREFDAIREGMRKSAERYGQVMAVVQVIDMVAMLSTLKMSLPRLPPPPAAPVSLGVALAMGANGVMTGSQIVVSAEWVEMIRRLVQAGVISIPAVSAAVRIHAGQVMMAQGDGELPQGVRDALGDSPEVRGMRVTGKAGAGMSEAPKHHVLPNEHREWFEQHGFKGAMDIDQFCVRLEQAQHEAIHGGGNWKLGRIWPGEWNRMIMKALGVAEVEAGRALTRNEVLQAVAYQMKRYNLPMEFTPWSGR